MQQARAAGLWLVSRILSADEAGKSGARAGVNLSHCHLATDGNHEVCGLGQAAGTKLHLALLRPGEERSGDPYRPLTTWPA